MTTYNEPNPEETPATYQADSPEEAREKAAQAEYAERQINELRNQDWRF